MKPTSVLLFFLLSASGCATGPDSRTEPVMSQRCTNLIDGFSVSYPEGWHSNEGAVVPPCTAFDPEPFEIPRESEMPFEIAVVIGVEEADFGELARPSIYERVLSTERLAVDGRPALRIEAEASGEGLAPRGMRSLRYVIDLGGGKSLIATTHDTDSANYESEKRTLAVMVESLDLP